MYAPAVFTSPIMLIALLMLLLCADGAP